MNFVAFFAVIVLNLLFKIKVVYTLRGTILLGTCHYT